MVGQMRSTRSRRTDPTDIAGTPWARCVNKLVLGDELALFRDFMSLQDDEQHVREMICKKIQNAVRILDANATVKPCGEHGYGMARYTSDVDVVIEVFDGSVDRLAYELLQQNAWDQKMEVAVEKQDPAFLRICVSSADSEPSVYVNITISNAIRTVERQTATFMRKKLSAMPAVANAAFALDFIMKSALTEKFTKLSLLLLVIGYAQATEQDPFGDGGAFLLSFMHFMSKSFDASSTIVDVTRGGLIKRTTEEDALVIIHPVTRENLTKDCDTLSVMRIKMTMHCVSQMEVADRELRCIAEVTSDKPRTVLSTVIAYHEYWPRSFKLNRSRKIRGLRDRDLVLRSSITSTTRHSISDESSSQQSSQQ
eukprot:TRINITY_DN708_c2_g1_i1.p1 TRINITY_DN708_c2_g1~~TRINITY_DN708_c2_g1_i1.p1  ORF type:complete len:368 (+),score=50.71 TRINITY_DN708_c2_g1_i1:87-1190(+)